MKRKIAILLFGALALAGCTAGNGYYYDPSPVVIVHHHTTVTHVHVYAPRRVTTRRR